MMTSEDTARVAEWTCPKCSRTYPYQPAKCHYCLADARAKRRLRRESLTWTHQSDPFAGIPNAHDEWNKRF